MEAMTKEVKKPILQTLGEGMLQLQREIEELALQLSLGRANAQDKFEEIKHEFTSKLTGLKQLLSKIAIDRSVPISLEWKLQDLELQLQSNKVASKESFEKQREALIAATIALEKEIVSMLQKNEVTNYFHQEAEKFLLKLEILRLKFGIKKFEIKDGFRTQMTNAQKIIENLSDKTEKIGSKIRGGRKGMKREVATAYKHLKNAVKNL